MSLERFRGKGTPYKSESHIGYGANSIEEGKEEIKNTKYVIKNVVPPPIPDPDTEKLDSNKWTPSNVAIALIAAFAVSWFYLRNKH